MKKFPNRCWNIKSKLEKIKRIYKRVFSGFYCFPNKTCVLRVNAKISFLELQLRKFNIFCSFFVCSISYRFYDYPEIFMKIRCFFPCQKLAACILDGYKSPFFSSFSHGSNQFFKNSYEFIYQNLLSLIFHVDYEYVLRKN